MLQKEIDQEIQQTNNQADLGMSKHREAKDSVCTKTLKVFVMRH